jgi:hypothetical protein
MTSSAIEPETFQFVAEYCYRPSRMQLIAVVERIVGTIPFGGRLYNTGREIVDRPRIRWAALLSGPE